MAELPIPTSAATEPVINPVAVPGTDFLRGVLGMPMTRQLLLLVALAGSVALGVAAVLWMQTPDFRPLTSVNDPYQAQEIGQALDAAAIEYRIDPQSGTLLVAGSDYHRARMQLAGADALGQRQLGYELLDREQGFGVSQAMESVQRRRSLEGELARSIATISSVQSARVLLAEPQRTAFVRDRRKATASVSVSVSPGRRLDRDQIRGIVNLVAGAVPELAPTDVAVVDQSGQLLSQDETDESLQQSVFQLEYVSRVEDSMRRKVANILAPSLGLTGFSAEVSVDVDFTRTEQTEELFNPDLTAVRSEAAITEESTGSGDLARGIPGALANDPVNTEANPNAADGEDVRRSRNEVTKNYEVDRTISHTRMAPAMVSRVSVSVVVDDKPALVAPAADDAADAESEPVAQPWTEEELERLAALVRNAVGFSAARGDSVTIVNRPFYTNVTAAETAVPLWQQPWVMDAAKQLLGGVALILVVLLLLRPLFRNLSQAGAVVKEQQTMALARMAEENAALASAAGGSSALMSDGVAGLLPAAGHPGANRLEAIRNIVSEDPERAAQVVKHWVSNDE